MENTEKSLLPHLAVPVERKLFDSPAIGANGAAAVVASNEYCRNYCRNSRRRGCYEDCVTTHATAPEIRW